MDYEHSYWFLLNNPVMGYKWGRQTVLGAGIPPQKISLSDIHGDPSGDYVFLGDGRVT